MTENHQALLNIARGVIMNSIGPLCSQLASDKLTEEQRSQILAEIDRGEELLNEAQSLLTAPKNKAK